MVGVRCPDDGRYMTVAGVQTSFGQDKMKVTYECRCGKRITVDEAVETERSSDFSPFSHTTKKKNRVVSKLPAE